MVRTRDLRADLVPHVRWPWRRWFFSGARYYHGRRRRPPPVLGGERVLDLIDPDLRPLCRALHDAGLRTAPSCQGHFHPEQYFRKIWEKLQVERELIRGPGLPLLDAETGRVVLFHDPSYVLPWPGLAAFAREAAARQSVGYLGVLVPPGRGELGARLRRLELRGGALSMGFDLGPRRLGDMEVFHVFLDTGEPRAQAEAWRELTARIVESIGGLASARSRG